MKFSLFIHAKRVTSDQSQYQLYQEFIELCQIADSGGMHTIWTGEHHALNFTMAPNPLISLVDLAHRTKHIRLGTGTIVAPYWHPINLAGSIAMADILTEGRLEIGIGRGAYNYEYERLVPGVDAWAAGQRLRELVPAIQKLWEGNYEHKGEHWSFPTTTSVPLPLQKPHPPLWIAARHENSHEFAIENYCNVQVTPLWRGDDEVESLAQKYKAACAKYPNSTFKPKAMLLRHTYVGSNKADIAMAADEISMFYNLFGVVMKNNRPFRDGLIGQITEEEIQENSIFSPDKMLKNNVLGDSSSVIERIQMYKQLGFDQYVFWIDAGQDFQRKKASLVRFIEKVMPAF